MVKVVVVVVTVCRAASIELAKKSLEERAKSDNRTICSAVIK